MPEPLRWPALPRTRLSSPSEHEDLLTKQRILGHQLRAGPECIDGGDAGQRCRGAGGPWQVDSVPTKSVGTADDSGSHGLDQTGWHDGLLSHREAIGAPGTAAAQGAASARGW